MNSCLSPGMRKRSRRRSSPAGSSRPGMLGPKRPRSIYGRGWSEPHGPSGSESSRAWLRCGSAAPTASLVSSPSSLWPGQQTRPGAVLDRCSKKVDPHLFPRQLWAAQVRARLTPLPLECLVRSLVAADVVRDQLLVGAGAVGDLLDSRPGKAPSAELLGRRVEELLARLLGVAPPLGWIR